MSCDPQIKMSCVIVEKADYLQSFQISEPLLIFHQDFKHEQELICLFLAVVSQSVSQEISSRKNVLV